MKKKTLIILLIIPFIISLLTFVSIIALNIVIGGTIDGISWNYAANEGFKIRDEGYKLEAKPVYDEHKKLVEGEATLTWSIRKINDSDEEFASVKKENDTYYLFAEKEGKCIVACSNLTGTKTKSFEATIFENGALIINPLLSDRNDKIDKNEYFGEYDYKYDDLTNKLDKLNEVTPLKEEARIKFNFKLMGDTTEDTDVNLIESSANLTYDKTSKELVIKHSEDQTEIIDSYATFASVTSSTISDTYRFKVVKDAVNIYNYNDLLFATNLSKEGEKACLRVSLLSLKDVYEGSYEVIPGTFSEDKFEEASKLGFIRYKPTKKKEGKELFGNFNLATNKFNFENELYTFKTTYNHEYIDSLNEKEKKYSDEIKVGIRVQKDFYGNGYEINADGLAFPRNGKIEQNTGRLTPSKEDYFNGPLGFVAIGDIEDFSQNIVKAYGQDNIGLLIDGDNITLNDIKMRNIDQNSNRANYTFTGTVVEVSGKNNTIKNSILSDGKNIVRAFNADNLLIDNSIIKRSGEFNLKVGSNKYNKYNENQKIDIKVGNYNVKNDSYEDFFNAKAETGRQDIADYYNDLFLRGNYSKDLINTLHDGLLAIQSYLDNTDGIINNGTINYDSNITVKNTLFGDSGIFSIAFETLFNGIYLYNGYPSYVASILGNLGDLSKLPSKIGGTSYPVKLTLEGDTRFYDWKVVDEIDVDGLVNQAISKFLESLGSETKVTIDDIFPMRKILKEKAKKDGLLYVDKDQKEWINTEIAWCGGGKNLSTLVNNITSDKNSFSEKINVDILLEVLSQAAGSSQNIMMMLKTCVLFASGFNPFNFITNTKVEENKVPSLFGEAPKNEDLISRS